jgi:hypothetical protein
MSLTDRASHQNELVLAYRTTDRVEAGALASRLEDADIAPQIIGDYRDSAYPGLIIGSMPDKEIWVAKESADAAAAIVGQWRSQHHAADVMMPDDRWQGLKTVAIVMGIIFLPLAVSMALTEPLRYVAAIIMQLAMGGTYFYFAIKRLREKRRALNDDDSHPTVA